jgi:hypothetical protein
MLPGRDRRHDLDLVGVLLDVLNHDDGVHAGRQRIAGVHEDGLIADAQSDRCGLGRAQRLLGSDGRAVHRGAVVVRIGERGPDGSGRHSSQRFANGHLLGFERTERAGSSKRVVEAAARLVERDVLQVDLTRHGFRSVSAR